jgi:hypothetical protein
MRAVAIAALGVVGALSCQTSESRGGSESSAQAGQTTIGAEGGRASAGGGEGRGGNAGATGSTATAGSSASGGPSATGGDGSSGGDAASADQPIGEWSDSPGECPPGSMRVDIRTLDEMQSASRGESAQQATCFFVHDGVYQQSGSTLPLTSTTTSSSAEA